MSEERNPFLRFSDAFDVEKMNAQRVTIIGAGGIGAPAALALAKSGVKKLKIYDFDEVSDENTGPQMYGPGDVGQPKVEILERFLKHQAPWSEVETWNCPFEDQKLDCDILVAAVDSLQTRRAIWRRVLQAAQKPSLLIDPRMGVEVLTLFSVEPSSAGDVDWYRTTLEGEAIEATCTNKATFYTGMVAGAMVSQVVKAYVANERATAEFNLDMRFLNIFSSTVEQKRYPEAA